MAEHNAIRFATPLLRALARFAGLAEDEAGVSRLGETLTPVIDIWDQPDAAFLREVRLMSNGAQNDVINGVLRSGVGLANPAGSGVIATIHAIRMSAAGASIGVVRTTTVAEITADLPTVQAAGAVRDRRWVSERGVLQVRLGTATAAPQGIQLDEVRWAAGVFGYAECVPVILPPGFGVTAFHSLISTAIAVGMYWSERQLLPGELEL